MAHRNFPFFLLLAFSQWLLAQGNVAIGIHPHNDNKQGSPFWFAFESGLSSLEADIFLENDTLYVTHDEADIIAGDEFGKLYLKPLQKVLSDNRFWATPDIELARKTFGQLGSDFINTDKPREYADYIEALKKEHQN